jgi:hypothetical protein
VKENWFSPAFMLRTSCPAMMTSQVPITAGSSWLWPSAGSLWCGGGFSGAAWAEIAQSVKAKAQRTIQEQLQALGWRAEQSRGRRKRDARKVRTAARLTRYTTMALAWIAVRLRTGAPGHASCLLYRKERNGDGLARPRGGNESEDKWS